MNRFRREEGFTLTEAVVVIIITAILASVTFSAYRTYSKKARTHEAVNLLAMMRAAQMSYKTVNDVYLTLKPNPSEIPSAGQLWGDPGGNWSMLGVDVSHKVRYQYVCEAGNTDNIATSFKLTARTDLDGKGEPYDTWILANDSQINHTNHYK